MVNISKLETSKNKFQKAFIHKSWLNEHPEEKQSNERLEFLGDAVLEFIVSFHIFKKFPTQDEGYLTSLRANLVSTQALSAVAQKLELGEKLLLSKGEEESGGRGNKSLLANTLEALIGAIYLDQGLEETTKFIEEHIFSTIEEKLASPLKDIKSRLQEEVQSKGLPAPKYKVVKEEGPDHARQFTVDVYVDKKVSGRGLGGSKSAAQQAAATAALEKLSLKD